MVIIDGVCIQNKDTSLSLTAKGAHESWIEGVTGINGTEQINGYNA